MRKRYYLSFDMDDPRHREAEALIAGQVSRQRTEYVVASVLASKQAELLEWLVRQAVRDELKSLRLSEPQTEPEVELSELPDSLLNALEEL